MRISVFGMGYVGVVSAACLARDGHEAIGNPDRATPMNDLSTMNKILEYMTLQKPFVQFDLHEGRESAGEASLYARKNDPVDFAEKIAELLDDPERRRQMGEIGRARIEKRFSWDHSAPVLLAAYDRAFEKIGLTENSRRVWRER